MDKKKQPRSKSKETSSRSKSQSKDTKSKKPATGYMLFSADVDSKINN
jgi:hypothetical protein